MYALSQVRQDLSPSVDARRYLERGPDEGYASRM